MGPRHGRRRAQPREGGLGGGRGAGGLGTLQGRTSEAGLGHRGAGADGLAEVDGGGTGGRGRVGDGALGDIAVVIDGDEDAGAGDRGREVASAVDITAVLAPARMLGGELDAGEATGLARDGAQVADGAVHATGDVDQVADLDVVDGRHGEGSAGTAHVRRSTAEETRSGERWGRRI